MQREEVAKQSHGRGNAHHGFTDEGKDNKEDDGLGIEMQRVDLVMREHRIEEIGEGGIKLAQRA